MCITAGSEPNWEMWFPSMSGIRCRSNQHLIWSSDLSTPPRIKHGSLAISTGINTMGEMENHSTVNSAHSLCHFSTNTSPMRSECNIARFARTTGWLGGDVNLSTCARQLLLNSLRLVHGAQEQFHANPCGEATQC